MKLEFIEVGQIVNTHGVRGELKLNPWDVEPEVLRRCKTFYIDGRALRRILLRHPISRHNS